VEYLTLSSFQAFFIDGSVFTEVAEVGDVFEFPGLCHRTLEYFFGPGGVDVRAVLIKVKAFPKSGPTHKITALVQGLYLSGLLSVLFLLWRVKI
jgi:hypothetical protein